VINVAYNYFSPRYFGVGAGETILVEGVNVTIEPDGILDVAVEVEDVLSINVEAIDIIEVNVIIE
jgi:hypothetical protein